MNGWAKAVVLDWGDGIYGQNDCYVVLDEGWIHYRLRAERTFVTVPAEHVIRIEWLDHIPTDGLR